LRGFLPQAICRYVRELHAADPQVGERMEARPALAVLDAETGEVQWFGVSGEVDEAAALCGGLPRPVRAAYEAGPTGYGLARELERRGVSAWWRRRARSRAPRGSG
jgi:hypothetical protein